MLFHYKGILIVRDMQGYTYYIDGKRIFCRELNTALIAVDCFLMRKTA